MREIKFRGKSDIYGWMYGTFALIDGSCHIFEKEDLTEDGHHIRQDSDRPTWVDENTVGQYTGLTDKNGKKIFEGDIVKDDSGVVYPVVFSLTGFCLKYAPPYSCGFHYDMLPLSNYWHAHGAIIEVIGNIHDNPELLGGGNDGK